MTEPSLFSTLHKAWRCVCPRCAQGHLFQGFLTVVDRCAHCHLPLSRNDSGDGPAVFLTFILGTLLVPPALWLSFQVSWPLWLHTVVWGLVILGLTLGMLRPAKALVVALQFNHRPEEYDES